MFNILYINNYVNVEKWQHSVARLLPNPYVPKLGRHCHFWLIIVVCNYNVELIDGRVLPETPQPFYFQSILFHPRQGLHKPPYGGDARYCPGVL